MRRSAWSCSSVSPRKMPFSIVEFAKAEHEKGKPLLDAALEGARLRLRPILMTSLAFIFGLLPLWFATGSGAVARRILGSTVIGGMIAASAIAIFLIPVTFYVVERLATRAQAGRLRIWRRRLLHSLSQFRNMDTAIVTGLTGIFGSLLGGSASVATAWVTQRTSNKRKEFHAERLQAGKALQPIY